jgi:hypothetical protein
MLDANGSAEVVSPFEKKFLSNLAPYALVPKAPAARSKLETYSFQSIGKRFA